MSSPPPGPAAHSARHRALHALVALGWQHLGAAQALALRGGTREVLLKARLIEVLQTRRFDYKGERFALSPAGIDQVVRQVQALPLAEGLLAANQRLYRMLTLGVTVTEFMPDGKKHQPTIALMDWQDPAANRWDLCEDVELLSTHGTHHRVADLVACVNGLPLVVIAAPPSTARQRGEALLDAAIAQQLRHQRPDEIPPLYAHAQLLLALGDGEGRYGTTGTPPRCWARWREEQFSDAQLAQWLRLPRAPTDQDRLLAGLLQPERLLEFLRLFVLFDRRLGKVVARYPQFFAVRALLDRVHQRRPDGGREGGVVWHTAGSGKSFTMVFLTRALLLHPRTQACRVVVVTDRLDLEDQLARNFLNSGAFGSVPATRRDGDKARVGSGRELARRIGQGSERIVFTLIHKFATASRLPGCYNPSADLIVLVDEGHRSHGGEMHERMRRALPRAACVAFTGTPLLKRDKTAHRFGPIVHAYTLQRAVDDGTVAPLLYEERVPELAMDAAAVNRWFERITAGLAPAQAAELQRRYTRRQAVYGAASRIELIAWDIAQHFSEHFKKPGLGLKGQLATASKRDAIRYQRCLDATGLVRSAVIISPPDSPEGDAAVDEDALPELRQWWNTEVGRHAAAYEARVLQAFGSDGGPDLLIVVDRLLTGFDEPRNAVLYMDKPLKEHNLMQAVARVNRLHEAKRWGLLVDYRGILEELDTAVRAYQDLETRTQGGYDIADLEGLYRAVSTEYQRLPALHRALWALFDGVPPPRDAEALRQALMPRLAEDRDGALYDTRERLRDAFECALTAFGLCLRTALASRGFFEDPGFPEALVQRYKQDLRWFLALRHRAREDALEAPEPGLQAAQLRQLLDRQLLGTQVREPEGAYGVYPLAPPEDEARWSDETLRSEADCVRTRLRQSIALELADDPYAQTVFAERLQRAIAEAEALFDHPRQRYALFRRVEAQLAARELDGMPPGLERHTPARAYFGICRLVLGEAAYAQADPAALLRLAHDIDAVVSQALAEHSLNPQSTEAAIRQALLPRLFGLMGLDKAREAIERVIQTARLGRAREGR